MHTYTLVTLRETLNPLTCCVFFFFFFLEILLHTFVKHEHHKWKSLVAYICGVCETFNCSLKEGYSYSYNHTLCGPYT